VSLRDEILEQPAVLRRLLAAQAGAADAIAAEVARAGVDYVYLAARGTSDNAGRYAQYAWGALGGVPVALAAPSLFSVYRRPPRLGRALAVGVSQSGQSPDIVAVLEEAARQGAPTLAITNDPASPLARAARFVLETATGPEEAVAATKTYTAQLLAIALLAAAMAPAGGLAGGLAGDLERVPGWIEEMLRREDEVAAAAGRHRAVERAVVLGRGYDYATAWEWSLKLKELAYVAAEPYSPSDFQHGPVAMIEPGFPVLAIAARGAALDGTRDLLARLAGERGAELTVLSNDERTLALAATPLPLPAALPEWLSPLVAIVPAQLYCLHLARARGCDTEAPRGLRKVTRTL
jgi:glucosamine--fructose-6-phosphate aminotransferase (isomerizing)